MKWYHILIALALTLTTLKVALAFDIDNTFNITEEQLPYEGTFDFIVVVEQGAQVNLTLTRQDAHILLDFVNSSVLENSDTANLSIRYKVEQYQVVNELDTLVSSILFSSNATNTTREIGFVFNINASSVFGSDPINAVSIAPRGYQINISSESLPSQGNLEYNIKTDSQGTLNFTHCGDFLQCPTHINVTGNLTKVTIPYLIPFNAPIGFTNSSFTLISSNTTTEGYVEFNILEPRFVFKDYTFQEKCYENDENFRACLEEKRAYDERQLVEYFNFLRSKQNQTEEKNQTKEIEYVLAGNFDDGLKFQLDAAILDQERMRNDLTSCNTQRDKLLNEKADWQNQLIQKDQLVETKFNEINTTITQEKERLKSGAFKWGLGGLGFLVLIGLLGGLYSYNRRFNHYGGL